ncbi:MAG TPA: hypothetical protein VJP80_00585 [Candidatus Saccharimonadales bacterium]|nr:hypothetical protein [Candidatus Saccharimonadales bacterium]
MKLEPAFGRCLTRLNTAAQIAYRGHRAAGLEQLESEIEPKA